MLREMNPNETSREVTGAAYAHDVVVASSKVLHSQPLGPHDLKSLEWAKGLLDRAASTEGVRIVPSADELVGTDDTLTFLRRAASGQADDRSRLLHELSDALTAMLGSRDTAVARGTAEAIRDLFAKISEVALSAQVVTHAHGPGKAWQRSMMSLSSSQPR